MQLPSFTETLTEPTENPIPMTWVRSELGYDPNSNDMDYKIIPVIDAATLFFEDYYQIVLITKDFESTFECEDTYFNILKTPNLTISDFVCFDSSGSEVSFTTDEYYLSKQGNRNTIIITDTTKINSHNPMYIMRYSAGYGTTSDDIPADVQLALMNIIEAMYNNGGDCSSVCGELPCATINIMNKYTSKRPCVL